MNPAFHFSAEAARRRRLEEEEQRMTQYNAEDLSGWEFKIVRSAFGRFGNAEVLRRLMAEEAQNGWEMVEKFDNYRIRFKRRTDKRSLHSGGSIDPYRTHFGASQMLMSIFAVAIALGLALILFVAQSDNAAKSSHLPPVVVVIAIILIAAVAMILTFLRRR